MLQKEKDKQLSDGVTVPLSNSMFDIEMEDESTMPSQIASQQNGDGSADMQ